MAHLHQGLRPGRPADRAEPATDRDPLTPAIFTLQRGQRHGYALISEVSELTVMRCTLVEVGIEELDLGAAILGAAAIRARQRHRSSDDTGTATPEPTPRKDTAMIWHMVRLTLKDGINEADKQAAIDSRRNQGEVIDAVRTSVVGPDVGGEFEWGAAYQLDDLDGYWDYLKALAHRHTDTIGLPLVDRFVSFDITDSREPDIHAKIADLHARPYAEDPELVELVQGLPSYTGSSKPQA